MKQWEALERFADIAVEQHGMVTRAQAAVAGITDVLLRRLGEHRALERMEHGVWRMAMWPDDPHRQLRALWLSLDPTTEPEDRLNDPQVFVSHESAARLYGAGHLVVRRHTFTSTANRRTNRPCNLFVAPVAGWRIIDGIAVTSPAQTLADLTDTGASGDHLGDIALDLVRRGFIRPNDLADDLDPLAGRFRSLSGSEALADLFADAGRSPQLDLAGWDRDTIARALELRGLALAA